MGINGGRSLRGIEETGGHVKHNISFPPSLKERLEKFMKDEDRNRSWVVQKAVDEYLTKRGY